MKFIHPTLWCFIYFILGAIVFMVLSSEWVFFSLQWEFLCIWFWTFASSPEHVTHLHLNIIFNEKNFKHHFKLRDAFIILNPKTLTPSPWWATDFLLLSHCFRIQSRTCILFLIGYNSQGIFNINLTCLQASHWIALLLLRVARV